MLRGRAVARATKTKYSQHWKQWCLFVRRMGWIRWVDQSYVTTTGVFCYALLGERLEQKPLRKPTRFDPSKDYSNSLVLPEIQKHYHTFDTQT